VRTVEVLLEGGAPLDSVNHQGHTALHCAFEHRITGARAPSA
jgi:ankyrin repeat protein